MEGQHPHDAPGLPVQPPVDQNPDLWSRVGIFRQLADLASSAVLTDLAKLSAVLVPLLPAVGCLARWSEVTTLGTDGQFAVQYPLGGLALTGAAVFLFPIYGMILYLGGQAVQGPRQQPRPHLRLRRAALAVGILALALFLPAWPGLWLEAFPVAFVLLTNMAMRRAGLRTRSLAAYIDTLLIAGISSALIAGWTGTVPGIVRVDVTLSPGPPLTSGTFILVGEDDASVVLTRCGGGDTYTISRAYVASMHQSAQPRPARTGYRDSLWSIIWRSGSPDIFNAPC